jgi:predicted amidophosphoribosyltransferase
MVGAMISSDETSCATCRWRLPPDARFCARCGRARPSDPPTPIWIELIRGQRRWRRPVLRALTLRDPTLCLTCWSQAPADGAFCFRCGADLSSAPPVPAVAPRQAASSPGDVGWRCAADALGYFDASDLGSGEIGEAAGGLLEAIGNLLGGIGGS